MDDGRRADIRELYAGCHHRLVGQLALIIGDLAAAEEALAEAFVRGLARPAQLLAMDSPEGWLRTVALNVARRRYRRAQLARTLLPRAVTGPTGDELDAVLDRVALYQALRRLPFEQREALVLHYVADMSVAEMAATLRVPEGTVKARLSRGRAAAAVAATTVKEG